MCSPLTATLALDRNVPRLPPVDPAKVYVLGLVVALGMLDEPHEQKYPPLPVPSPRQRDDGIAPP